MIEVPVMMLLGALGLDLAFGDPKNRHHPTAWIGSLVAKVTTSTTRTFPAKIAGVIITISTASLVGFLLISFDFVVKQLGGIASVLVMVTIGAILLKTTIAIRGLERHGASVMESLSQDNMPEARSRLAMLVKRNTKDLDKNHIASGVLETTSENIVDGITGPLFYFGLFGLPGAFVYRVINTIDSMMGYRNNLFKDLGWFGANCDKVLNFVPSRLTAYVMVLAAAFTGDDWKGALQTIKSDGAKTQSPNAGYPMAAMAGALGTRFEKIGHYCLGSGSADLGESHFHRAIKLMKVTSILFCIVVTIPIAMLLSYLGWWIHV